MLAAFGLQRWLDGDAAVRRRMLIAAGALAALPALAAFAAHPGWLGELPDGARRMLGRGPDDADAIALAAVLRWVVAAAAAVALLAFLRGRARIGAVACLVVGVDLLVLGFGYNPAIEAAQANPPEPAPVAVLRSLSGRGGAGRRDRRARAQHGLALGAARRTRPRAAGGRARAARLDRDGRGATVYHRGVRPVGRAHPAPARPVRRPRAAAPGGERAAAGRRRLRTRARAAAGAAALAAGGIVLHDGPDGVVLERESALPRAFVAYGWQRSAGLDESVAGMTSATAEALRDRPVIETAADPPVGTPPPATPARITHDGDTEVTVAVDARAPGRLVLLDAHYPGWKATVDGRRSRDRAGGRRVPASSPSRPARTPCASPTGRRACGSAWR